MVESEKIDWARVVNNIVGKMLNRYPFLGEDVIRSAAHEGAWKAFLKFDADKCKASKEKYVSLKGYFKTIDILREERWLWHKSIINKPKILNLSEGEDEFLLDDLTESKMNFDKFWFELTDGLDERDTKILYMKFVEKQTMTDIGKEMHVCNSAVQRYLYKARKQLCKLQGVSDKNVRIDSRWRHNENLSI